MPASNAECSTWAQVFADAALSFATSQGVSWEDIDVVASHGQTMWHIPLPEADQVMSTLQMMASGPILPETSMIMASDSVCEFRNRPYSARQPAVQSFQAFVWAR
jgi:1,6-anhydro-N-acetylmuramate kinase